MSLEFEKKQNRLKVFENWVLRKIFRHKEEESTRDR
jgi:hypothetical protein